MYCENPVSMQLFAIFEHWVETHPQWLFRHTGCILEVAWLLTPDMAVSHES